MKRIASLLSAALVAGLFITGCNNAATTAAPDTQADTTATAGSIVFFNIDKVVENYDMANDLRSVVETKVRASSPKSTVAATSSRKTPTTSRTRWTRAC